MHHGIPSFLDARWNIGVAVTWEVDDIGAIFDGEEVDELCAPGSFADASQILLLAQDIEERRFSDV